MTCDSVTCLFIEDIFVYRSDYSQHSLCVPHAHSTGVDVLGTLAPSSGTSGFCPSGLAPHSLLHFHDNHRGRGCSFPCHPPFCAIQTGQNSVSRDNANRGTHIGIIIAVTGYETHIHSVYISVVAVGDWAIQTDGSWSVSLAWLRCAGFVQCLLVCAIWSATGCQCWHHHCCPTGTSAIHPYQVNWRTLNH